MMVKEYNSSVVGGGVFIHLYIARTEIVESTKIVAVKVVNKMIPKFFNLDLMIVGGWDRLITGMLFQSLGIRKKNRSSSHCLWEQTYVSA